MQVSKAVRTGIFEALEPLGYYVYDVFALPENATFPYILISTQTAVQRGSKTCKDYNASVLIDVVTGSTDPIGREQSEDIAEDVQNIINPDNRQYIDLTPYGYEMATVRLEQDTDNTLKNDIYYIYRKLLRFNFLISKY